MATVSVLPTSVLSRKEEIAAHFLQLLEEHIHNLMKGEIDHRYTAKEFSSLLFIHPRHLTNTIKLVTGKSPCDHMEERIIEEAQRLLRDSTLSIAEIGYKFAYFDPSNFTKFFKVMMGVTPLQYRKQLLGSM